MFILDEEDQPLEEIGPIVCDDWLDEFLGNIIKSSSIGPQIIDYFEWNDVDVADYEIIEIMTVSNLTEALLIITNRIEGLTNLIPVEVFQEIMKLINWDYKKIIAENNFEDSLSEIVKQGRVLIDRLPQIPESPS